MVLYYAEREGDIIQALRTNSSRSEIMGFVLSGKTYEDEEYGSKRFRLVLKGKSFMAHSLFIGNERIDALGHREIRPGQKKQLYKSVVLGHIERKW